MKVSLRWLRDYVDITLPIKELAERLTMAGIEVKEMQITGGTWENIVIGEIVAVEAHPNADRLKLVTVHLGQKQLTVVSGAPNLRTGDKVPFAYVGAQLIDGHTGEIIQLKPAKIRGALSEGVVCSEKELGISDSHEGIMVLSPEAPAGTPLADYLGDVIFNLDVTPNRPDCLSVIGVAREIAALTEQTVRLPQVSYEESTEVIDSLASVKIVEPVLCPRYCASMIIGVSVAPSPRWLQQRLLACGMRPINNIVDVTNYVMLEYGQPLHAFDYHRIAGRQIIVRLAKGGEVITTLDGMERAMTSDMLVIADAEHPVAIAGIMGGLDTEISEETTAVLIESANFNRSAIRQTSANLGLRTEASLRFEKGLSSELPLPALKRATRLILEIAGGKAAKGILDVYPGRQERQPLLFSTVQISRLLGVEVGTDEAIRTLTFLSFECQKTGSSEQISVTAPYWRTDISNCADLVEEVARIIGYDKIPATMLSTPIPVPELKPEFTLREKLRSIMVSCGFQEVLTYSLTSLDMLRRVSPDSQLTTPLKVANPITKEQEYLRTTLRAKLLATLNQNQRYETGGIRLFEIGKVFLPQEKDLPEEREKLCAVLSGPRSELSWRDQEGLIDFFNTKGVMENLLSWLGEEIKFDVSEDRGLHPGKRADIIVDGIKVGVMGELHPKVSEAFELSGTTYLIELDLKELLPLATRLKKYSPLPRFPGVIRDIAIVVAESASYQQVKNIIQSFPPVAKVNLFDLYRGEQVPRGKKSLALRIVYQAPTHTLTDEEIIKVQEQILDTLYRELGATLRS